MRKVETRKKLNQEKEENNCTFEPKTIKPPKNSSKRLSEPFLDRNEKWTINHKETLKKKIEENQKDPLIGCTFTPAVKNAGKIMKFDSAKFYARNIKWAKEKQENTNRKIQEMFPIQSTKNIRKSSIKLQENKPKFNENKYFFNKKLSGIARNIRN